MSRAMHRMQIVKAAAVLLTGLLLVTSPSCKKKVPAPPPPAEEALPPAPTPEMPSETVPEAPIPPAVEPETPAEDLDDIIERQNRTREFLKTVYFDFDRAEVRDDQVPVLQGNAAWLKSHSQYRVLIEGHCDERDTIEYNLALGDRRAKNVMQYLVDLGISPGRIRTISYGEERPGDPGHDEAAFSRNRRVEFTLEKAGS